jgi:hypothetical protein
VGKSRTYIAKPIRERIPKVVGRREALRDLGEEAYAFVKVRMKANACLESGTQERQKLYTEAKAGDTLSAQKLWERYRIRAVPVLLRPTG